MPITMLTMFDYLLTQSLTFYVFLVLYRTVLMLIKMMMEYCQCVVDIPTATPDLLTRLIDLLKVKKHI